MLGALIHSDGNGRQSEISVSFRPLNSTREEAADDTISAISTPPGKGGVCVIRISGGRSLAVIRSLFMFHGKHREYQHRVMYAGNIVDPADKTVVDSAMCVFMKAPNSYTGEDSAEIHCHGGDACSRRIMELTLRHGCRAAGPGEFTRRAFMNGKMDLAQAQAVADIINAQSDLGLRQAGLQLSGGLSDRINKPKRRLLELLAEIEARIDFPEEETGEMETGALKSGGEAVREDLEALLGTYTAGSIIREGAAVAITGEPNVGKSSLLNALLGRKRAITSPRPGTTRDYIEEQTSIGGIAVRLTDTAGVREARDEAEKAGVRMAKEKARDSDVQIIVIDSARPLSDGEREMIENAPAPAVVAVNKSDLGGGLFCEVRSAFPQRKTVATSAKTGAGIEDLKEVVRETLVKDTAPVETNEAALTSIRHKQAAEAALGAVNAFLKLLEEKESAEILSIKVKEAMDKLGEITGETSTEEMLGVIFGKFCIGK